jgi:acyl transferase domain-containing protein/acyl carrier protein
MAQHRSTDDLIAIIGMSCRFPGAADLASFWRLLREERDAIAAPPDRSIGGGDSGKLPVEGVGGLLDGIDGFDSEFFGLSPRVAAALDPQQRLLLEVAWEAMEDAGYRKEAIAGSRAAVYAGLWAGDFENTIYTSGEPLDVHYLTGIGRFPGPNRISYLFDLRGPSVAVDTACSSSLVAVHLACRSIRSGECDLAIAAGVNAILRPEITEAFLGARMLSPDRRCKFGDRTADGFVRSEGCGVVVLKRLSSALRDGDSIYAVIRGTAVNNDGQTSGELLFPSREGQEALIHEACADASILPSELQYVEAHGTGTSAGDPVEIEALGNVVGSNRTDECRIGSVKTNIGHTEGAAGVAGLIKVALSLWQGELPASLHFREPNPKAPWEKFALRIPQRTEPWPSANGPALAGVSAFGITGTNAHAILEAAPEASARPRGRASRSDVPRLVPLSARNADGLKALATSYRREIDSDGLDSDFIHVAHSAARRTPFDHRLAIVACDRNELGEKLGSFLQNESANGLASGVSSPDPGKIAFVFPGQGAQWTGMARRLYADEPVFRAEIDRCDAAMRPLVEFSLASLFQGSEPLPQDIDVIQPALFAVSAGLAALWRHWGVKPDGVVGHSMGEIGAAYVAGALSLEDAARVVCLRSALMRRVRGLGGMALVELGGAELDARLAGYGGLIAIAARNSSGSTVLSGQPEALQRLLVELEAAEIFCRSIKVDVASHSAYVDPILDDLALALAGVTPRLGGVPIYSTVTSQVENGSALDADYWVRNLRQPVLFGSAVQSLIADGFRTFLELSPHPLLVPSVQAGLAEAGQSGLALGSMRREEDERSCMLASAGALHVAGHRLEWERLNGPGRCVSLPPLPLQRERAWPDVAQAGGAGRRRRSGHPFLDQRVESSLHPGSYFWEMEIGAAAAPFLSDHRVRGMAVFPAAAHLEIVCAAARELGVQACEITGFDLRNALVLSGGEARKVQLVAAPEGGGWSFRASSREGEGKWLLLAGGAARPLAATAEALPLDAIQARCPARLASEDYYAKLADRGLQYGPAFQLCRQAFLGAEEVLARLTTESAAGPQSGGYVIHPAILDAALQAAEMLPRSDAAADRETFVPVSIRCVRQYRAVPPGAELYGYAVRRQDPAPGEIEADVCLADSEGNVIAQALGFVSRRLDAVQAGDAYVYELEWLRAPEAAEPAAAAAKRWLLFADRSGVAESIAARLRRAGAACVLAFAGGEGRNSGASNALDPQSAEQLDRLLQTSGPFDAIAHFWSLDALVSPAADAPELETAEQFGPKSVVRLIRAISAARWPQPPELWIATGGAYSIDGSPVVVTQAPTWGLGRVVACEHPELRCRLVDLSPGAADAEVEALARVLAGASAEDQIALRGENRYVARYRALPPADAAPRVISADSAAYRVEIGEPGKLQSLALDGFYRRRPGRGEVEIAIAAGGLNFIDVLKALGIQPGIAEGVIPPLGGECAGRVVAVGAGVEHLREGDEVVALTPSVYRTGMLASHALTPAALAAHKPAALSMEEAASIPLAFLTAWYGLHNLGRLRRGERVLIHAGAGGVGLAAIQIARQAGARVFATAGSAEKRKFLESIGVEGAFDSRSAAFLADVREATGGEGVDLVLNSLAGELREAGVAALAPYGRFIEIGKRDLYENQPMALGPFRRNLSFFALDLAAMLEERTEEVSDLLREVMAQFEAGHLRATPVTPFPASRAAEAFEFMAGARHIGKIVVTFDEPAAPVRSRKFSFRPDAGYLITGGLGGIGLHVAEWMVENGARHLALAGRSAPSPDAHRVIARLEAAGARVRTFRADLSRDEDAARLVQAFGAGEPPLRGVFHAAAALDDALLLDVDLRRWPDVMAAKAYGAWRLHRLTEDAGLDCFVLFSSIAAVLPQPGHGSYAAANAFLDGLARHRRTRGLAGLSVNWGGWRGTGLARTTGADRSMAEYAARGLQPFSPRQGVEAIGALLHRDATGALVTPIDWRTLAAAYGREGVPPMLQDLLARNVSREAETLADAKRDIRSAPPEMRRDALETHLCGELSSVLRLSVDRIDRKKRLGAMGLDSLMAVAFVRRLSASLGVLIPATAAFNYPTIEALAGHVAARMGLELEAVTQPAAATGAARTVEVDGAIDALSEEEAVKALMRGGQS